MDIKELLTFSVKNKASDLHLSAGQPPLVRIDGDLQRIDCTDLDNKTITELIYSIMNDLQRKHYEVYGEVDFSFEIGGVSRFRANVFKQNRGIAGAFRTIATSILTLDELGFSPILKSLCGKPNGLILVTGPTGSGKSTTLAAMIDYINTTRAQHIITIEDPVEFIHQSKKCLVNQREVFRDTCGFNEALRATLREDPDVILIGELRDLETIKLALTAAETGHLVFATLHTQSAAKTINRIIDVFPAQDKAMVRTLLAETLQAVVAQTLAKKIGGGRVAAHEIMICTNAVRNLIREDKIAQIYSTMQTGAQHGMQTLEQHLQILSGKRIILDSVVG